MESLGCETRGCSPSFSGEVLHRDGGASLHIRQDAVIAASPIVIHFRSILNGEHPPLDAHKQKQEEVRCKQKSKNLFTDTSREHLIYLDLVLHILLTVTISAL